MEHYFIVLDLPHEDKPDLRDKVCDNFVTKAYRAIKLGKANLVSRRQDTGIADEVRMHAAKGSRFKTYLLLDMLLDRGEATENILKKAARYLNDINHPTLIDRGHNYQLLTVEISRK